MGHPSPNATVSSNGSGPRVYLGCVGDANWPHTFSGIPYHLLQAAKDANFIDEGLTFVADSGAIRARRWAWNAVQVLAGKHYGGYQYTDGFLTRLWAPALERLRGNVIINQFQMYPLSIINDPSITKWYYIDGTLKQLYEYYRTIPVDPKNLAEIMEREGAGYRSAEGVVTLSRYAADGVIADYGVPASKVHVVVPGANLTDTELAQCSMEPKVRAPDQPPLLAFVGRTWERKGLDRLLRAMLIAQRQGARLRLRVMGLERNTLPGELRDVPNVEWCGFISRTSEGTKLLRLISECDVGCLLSRAEFSSIALREYLAFGLIVLGPKTGGCGDMMEPECSIGVTPEGTDEEIAGHLLALERDHAQFNKMKEAAVRLRHTATWACAVPKFKEFWPYVR